MKTYRGTFEAGEFKVYVEGSGPTRRELDPRLDKLWFSPRGEFEWGNNCSESNQLAFALVMDALDGDAERSRAVYRVFKWSLLLLDPGKDWTMSLDEVLRRVLEIEAVMLDQMTREPTETAPF